VAQEKASVTDEERGNVDPRGAEEKLRAESGDSISVPMMTDVFTWRHLQYDVTLKKGETRRLLEDVSGFVAPGKLTALMGESGAGKVCESRKYAEEYVLISTSLDYVVECSGRASSGWCCPWRETCEWISSPRRLPGTDVSLGISSICFGVHMSGRCSGYVQQMDTHLAQTTVREALLFSAKLRQPPSVPIKEKEA